MLDDVERRSFLVEPAGKYPLITSLRIAHVELDEGSGQPLIFPRRGGLTGAQPDDGVSDSRRLAGPQCHVAHQSVTLVQQAKHRHPFGHRRRSGRHPLDLLRHIDRLDGQLVGRARLPVAGGEQQQKGERRPAHAYSGFQA
jgi:hypothetical protein